MDINQLTGQVIGAAINVHKALGPGLSESIYEECLCIEFDNKKIEYERQKEIPIEYRGVKLNTNYRIDLVVQNKLLLELKACETLLPIHEAQTLTYLKLTGLKIGLLINFSVLLLKDGIKRFAN